MNPQSEGRSRSDRAEGSDSPLRRKAVALKYSPETSSAPVVVAKGRGLIADEIVKRAQENGVPIQEDASLVEVLSKLDLEQEIPPELYRLVAEVLSFVYRADRRAGLKNAGSALLP
ncbi:EscU/YscU/HrcU family type III secretion system export apparatus switch protein [Cohnella zeiphila]|uniref:EscU/YscU/HrcU family type III secretion system export apparatus switch protein n=1 Tax=Cohnella zeiphila TaxID=2761120 RepID=A0A7X0VWW4_9BACL|nr:EscU/YscU/HrcU family type III secretion system export apparatus switch protein [Cohnella zeiphila]MBB6732832.1 EscU/YscU/HrcU family type III secretion system export apparatus switch protein [Cohnella zeiphila]